MDWDEMSNLYRGPSIDASYQVSDHLAEGFQRHIQSNLSYVTFQGNIEIGSNKTGGHYIQVKFI